MEQPLRCNALKCREDLKNHAIVTTCSHIFCINCSKGPELSDQTPIEHRNCPACKLHLGNPHDAVLINLNPPEDYKASILSGLSPDIILECTGRALSFWTYQTTQEIVYQRYVAGCLTDKYATLNMQMDKLVRDANAEISNLRARISNMQANHDSLVHKNEELVQAIREKNRKHLQTQELYDKLKRRNMLGQVQKDASAVVDHIQASASRPCSVNRIEENQYSRPTDTFLFPNTNVPTAQGSQINFSNSENRGLERGRHQESRRSWAGLSEYDGVDRMIFPKLRDFSEIITDSRLVQTPSIHTQPLVLGQGGSPRTGLASLQRNTNTGTPIPLKRPSPRQPLTNVVGNGFSGNRVPRYGMSAGMKVSNPANGTGGSSDGFVKPPLIHSRVAHRPPSAFPLNRNGAFGQLPPTNMFSIGQSNY